MTTTTGNAVLAPAPAPPRRPAGSFRRLLRKPLGVIPLIIFVVLVLLGIFGPLLADNSPTFASLDRVNASAGSSGWLLGGDQYGRDIWARVLASIRVSLTSAVIGAGVGVLVGTTF
jgi:ABC-type dipeptide/oligopeptide/nickel transport system permease subunit